MRQAQATAQAASHNLARTRSGRSWADSQTSIYLQVVTMSCMLFTTNAASWRQLSFYLSCAVAPPSQEAHLQARTAAGAVVAVGSPCQHKPYTCSCAATLLHGC